MTRNEMTKKDNACFKYCKVHFFMRNLRFCFINNATQCHLRNYVLRFEGKNTVVFVGHFFQRIILIMSTQWFVCTFVLFSSLEDTYYKSLIIHRHGYFGQILIYILQVTILKYPNRTLF